LNPGFERPIRETAKKLLGVSKAPLEVEAIIENWAPNPESNFNALMDFFCPHCAGSVQPLNANREALEVFYRVLNERQLVTLPRYVTTTNNRQELTWRIRYQIPTTRDITAIINAEDGDINDILPRVKVLLTAYMEETQKQEQ
jgi:hypothetical protein